MLFDLQKAPDLTERFNRRDIEAFGLIYLHLYDQLHYFTTSLCRGSDLVADDVIQDIFVRMWMSSSTKFSSVEQIKAYILTSTRNHLYNHFVRKKTEELYRQSVFTDDDRFVVEITESGIWSWVNQAIEILPEECAKVLRYHLEGWQVKEIADKMGVSERTVRNRKNEAIDKLRSHFGDKIVTAILLIFSHL